MSISRLELQGNLILVRLMCAVENALKTVVHILRKFYYTDSKLTLSWVKSIDKEFETFVENSLKKYENFQITMTEISSKLHKIQQLF